MSVVVTSQDTSFPLVAYCYKVTGLVNGANTITLPTPPATGSFPPADDWTPTFVWCFPYNAGAQGNLCTPDLTTISETSAGVVSFTLYAGGATSCLIYVA